MGGKKTTHTYKNCLAKNLGLYKRLSHTQFNFHHKKGKKNRLHVLVEVKNVELIC